MSQWSLPETAFAAMPEALRAVVQGHVARIKEAALAQAIELDLDGELQAALVAVLAASDFVAESFARDPALLQDLAAEDLRRRYDEGEFARRVGASLAQVEAPAELESRLRQLRRREMVRIAWRDLGGAADLAETLADLSALADACVQGALGHLHQWLSADLGTPTDAAGRAQSLVVIGMGKLGAGELNFSSDIDLMFAYPEEGETRGGRRQLSNGEYFIRLAQQLMQVLDKPTMDGRVFRVDARLRPFGDAGALALSFDAMEAYYQTHGREWERYAMIKARVIAGDQEAGAQLMQRLKPFVYRRYLDFGAFESLRDMKAMIAREVKRKGLADNVKLGPGGIREVEFIGQAFQLIRGGREPSLQARPILTVLERLARLDYLPRFVVDNLAAAYGFLRRTENRLQASADAQTHSLPADDLARVRLAWSMGCADWADFKTRLADAMRLVHEHFEQVFAAPQTDQEHEGDRHSQLESVWAGGLDEEAEQVILSQAGFADPGQAMAVVQRLKEGYGYRTLASSGRKRFNRLMPLLLGAVGVAEDPDTCLQRVAGLLESIAKRAAYIALLNENPMALSQLVRLCAASPWIAEQLGRHPLLLDELLDPRSLYAPAGREDLERELSERLAALPREDTEQLMDALRQFKQAHVLHVAAADVAGAMPLMVVSDHLTDIAEVILRHVLALAADHLQARHGTPRCEVDGKTTAPGFAVVAYGKLGGIELSYGSDLDLVFLHDSRGANQHTEGPKSVENALYFARLGQRMVHFLTAHTPAGTLYEVDTRLRPSGASGFLVSGLEAFAEYQRQQAWTWEHQALVRARVVAGSEAIARDFQGVRQEILCRSRDRAALQAEVRKMRERMRRELSKGGGDRFDIKQDPGGIADIEFMVQYGVLGWANEHPELARWTDNIRILETLAQTGAMAAEDSQCLADAYRAYRQRVHQLTLQQSPAVVPAAEFAEQRQAVLDIWSRWLE